VLVVLAVIVVAAVARPVVHAAEVAAEIVAYVLAAVAGCAVLAVAGYVAWRVRRRRLAARQNYARVISPRAPRAAVQAVTAPRAAAIEAPRPAINGLVVHDEIRERR
jgi:hypothetical protein